jgi:hypothetical protein
MEFYGRPLNSGDDFGISRATAQVAGQRPADLISTGLRVRIEQSLGRHQHPGNTIAALYGTSFDKSRLQRVWPTTWSAQALDGGDVVAIGLDGKDQAGLDRLSIHDHRASSTISLTAPILGSGQAQLVAQQFQEGRGTRDLG